MNEGAELRNNTNSSTDGGGLSVASGGVLTGVPAIFTMTGGSIHNNLSGGGIAGSGGGGVGSHGTFTMTGGSIHNNVSNINGGGVFLYYGGGDFTMTGGSIYGNEASYNAGAVYAVGNFIMNGGSIHDNVSNINGGGVFLYYGAGTFAMNGGSIYANKAGSFGGGVYAGDLFVKTGGTVYGVPDPLANLVIDSLGTLLIGRGHALSSSGGGYDTTLPDGTY
jgi:hypothetical protein